MLFMSWLTFTESWVILKKSVLLEEYIALNNAIFKDKSDADIQTLRLSFSSDQKEELINNEVREVILKERVASAKSMYLAVTILVLVFIAIAFIFILARRMKKQASE